MKYYGVTQGQVNNDDGDKVKKYTKTAWAGLDPKTVFKHKNVEYITGSGRNRKENNIAKLVHDKIGEYAKLNRKPNNIPDYSNDYSYSTYYTWAPNFANLMGAFNQLKVDAVNASKIPPILNFPTGEASWDNTETKEIARAIDIVDEIGKGLVVDTSTLSLANGSRAEEDTDLSNNGLKVYKFPGYESRVAITGAEDGDQTLSWFINADDLKDHIFSFKDRDNPQTGEYNKPEKGPLQLDYKVKPNLKETPENLTKFTCFSNVVGEDGNAKTVAKFKPPADSPYYYPEERTFNDKDDLIIYKKNEKGIEGTANYIYRKYMGTDGNEKGVVTVKLGNNGRLDVEMGIIKSGPGVVKKGNTITYEATVYNYTNEEKNREGYK